MNGGVKIRELRQIDEFEEVCRLFDDIWHPAPHNPPVTMELMIGFAHTGNYVAGAYDEGGTLVGASVGFRAAERTLHSHVTGAVIGRGIGHALKSHQREWCLGQGLERITWTFDPLVRRNARFNLVKLGAMPEEYLEDFYGKMADAINEGDASDRLLAAWRLTETAKSGEPPAAEALLSDENGWPVAKEARGGTVLVGTPADVERLRRENPAAAAAWRLAVRDALGRRMKAGWRVVGFTERGEYVVKQAN
ncbi:GNAT family N-acetyltransferase [Nonomuraea sp. NPDC003709]|uniref:GNAT family N-acetyltransferase n=1 Tax=Nonomuraea sp. NPDC003709 TaxID=3154450 RepID=UPI0033B9C089